MSDFLNDKAEEFFHIPYLFPYQRLAISNILDCAANPEENNPAQIVILPTGAGKSLCFMLPAVLVKGITLIIFPLLSLMADQKRRLDSAGIPNVILRGGLENSEKEEIFRKISAGEIQIIIANPEILLAPGILDRIRNAGIFHVVIDEAHTVSQWGDTFRPSYLRMGEVIAAIKPAVTTAFTATASAEILNRFREVIFSGQNPNIIRADPDRPNIRYDVVRYISKTASLISVVKNSMKPLIIFCSSRDGTEITARKLRKELNTDDVFFYHAGLERDEKKNIEDLFFRSATAILVATCAYGMGVDKPDIRTVIHADIPTSAEAYLQESGRGGRDRKQAYAIAMVPYMPVQSQDRRQQQLFDIFQGNRCRRKELLHILENENELCSGCDVCDRKVIPIEGKDEITELVRKNNGRMTLYDAVRILKGNRLEDSPGKRYAASDSWGRLSLWDEKEIRYAISALIKAGELKLCTDLIRRGKLRINK